MDQGVYAQCENIAHAVESARSDFAVLAGFEDEIMLAGGDGTISGLSNIAPELLVDMVRAGEGDGAAQACPTPHGYAHLPGIGAAKLAVKKPGVPISPAIRGPALPAESGEAIDAAFEAAGLLRVQRK